MPDRGSMQMVARALLDREAAMVGRRRLMHLLTSFASSSGAPVRADWHRYEQGTRQRRPRADVYRPGTAITAASSRGGRPGRIADGMEALDGALIALQASGALQGRRLRDGQGARDAHRLRRLVEPLGAGVTVPGRRGAFHDGAPAPGHRAGGAHLGGGRKIDPLLQLGRTAGSRWPTQDHVGGRALGLRHTAAAHARPAGEHVLPGLRSAGPPADLALWDVLRKPDVRPLLATPPRKARVHERRRTAPASAREEKAARRPLRRRAGDVWCWRPGADRPGRRAQVGSAGVGRDARGYQTRCMAALADDGPEGALSYYRGGALAGRGCRSPVGTLAHGARDRGDAEGRPGGAQGTSAPVPQNPDACLKYGARAPPATMRRDRQRRRRDPLSPPPGGARRVAD